MTAPMLGTTRPMGTAMLSGELPPDQPPNPGLMGDQDAAIAQKPQQPLGFWLDAPEPEVAKDLDEQWNAQNRSMKNRYARWDLNERRMDGDTYSKLVQDTDQDTFRIYTPENAELAPPSLNKTRDLSNKMVANLLVDPPKFECEPPSDTDEDIAASEFSTRALENEAGETGLDLVGRIEEAEDLACIYGSAFLRFYVDPNGGGRKPKEIYASAQATTEQDALAGPAPYFIRYLTPDGQITDDPTQAAITWQPKIRCEVITGRNLRFLPETATGIEDADGVLIASYDTLGNIKARFPETVGKMDDTQLKALVSYRPPDTRKLIPKWAGGGTGSKRKEGQVGPPDDAQVCVITGYRIATPQYPKGAYVCMAGGKFILERVPWEAVMTAAEPEEEEAQEPQAEAVGAIEPGSYEPAPAPQPKPPSKTPLAMDIPVAQFRQFRDAKGHDPYGRGLVDLIGDGDPIRAFIIGSVIEYLHRVNNPHLFVPIGTVHENFVGLPRGVPIPYNASAGGKPEYEQIAGLPGEFMELFEEIGGMQDSMSGLQQAAQGTADPTSQSGVAKQIVVEQALVALGKPKRAMDKGGIRSCRIVLQLMRQAYTQPQRLKVESEDGSYKEQEFTAADLRSTTDVRIVPGTSTMLPQSAKQDLILRYATPIDPNQPPILSMAEAKRLIRTGARSIIGMQDAKPLLRVKGQIKRWKDGPPDGWAPAAPPVDPSTGQPAIDAATGQPIPTPPDPANPFADQRPTDDEPENAKTRFAELSDLVSSSAYLKHGPEWAQYALTEYLRAKQSAGVVTIPEQQQMQAQMAQQQQQQMAAEQESQASQQQDAQANENEQRSAERAHKTELEAMKQQGAVEREAAKAIRGGP